MSKNSIRVSNAENGGISVIVSADASESGAIFVSRRVLGRLAEPQTAARHRLSGRRKSSFARNRPVVSASGSTLISGVD
jgi:hypothetical protein